MMDQWTSLSGCVRYSDGNPVADAVIALTPRGTPMGVSTTTTDAKGCYEFERVFPGSYYVEARLPEQNPPKPPIFYPSTAKPSEAQRVFVAPGAFRSGIDIQMTYPTLGVISGRVLDEDGKPLANVPVRISSAEGGNATAPIPVSYMPERFQPPTLMRAAPNPFPRGEVRAVLSGPDGRFRVEGIVPGPWRLLVMAGSEPSKQNLYATQLVELASPTESSPETHIELVAEWMFESQIRLDWSGPPPLLNQELGLSNTSPLPQASNEKPAIAPTSISNRFALPGPFNVSSLVQSDTLPEGYYFAAMHQGGADLHGLSAQLTRNAPPITLVFKLKAAQINGVVEGESAAIVLLWSGDLSQESVVRTTIARPGKTFHFASLAPGTYHLTAFEPPRDCRRRVSLSYATKAGRSSEA